MSSFTKNVLTLMTGTAVAQAIPIAISPILTRLYTPQDFGVFALFFSIVAVLGTIINARYELAIMLPKKDEDAINVFALGFIINVILSLFILVFIVLFHSQLLRWLGSESLSIWLYFIPFTVFFMGIWNILNYFNNRKQQYKDIARATVLKSLVLATVQLSIGFIKQGAMGLITGQILSNIFGNMRLAKNIVKDKVLLSKISKVKMIAMAKRYRDFPKFLMVSHFINSLSGQVIVFITTMFFGLYTLGLISFSQRLISIPLGLIGRSIGQVFFEESAKYYIKNGECYTLFKKTLHKLSILSLFISILIFFSAYLVPYVFGKSWTPVILYIHILIPVFFLQFIDSPLSVLFMVANKQKLDMLWQIYLIITMISAFIIGRCLGGIVEALVFYSAAYFLAYTINILFLFNFAKGK